MSDDGKVIDIYEWHRPRKPGEFRGCALAELPTPTETSRKLRPSELALAISLVALVSLLVASFI